MKSAAALFLASLQTALLVAVLVELRGLRRLLLPMVERLEGSARRIHFGIRNLRYDVKRTAGRGAAEPEDDA